MDDDRKAIWVKSGKSVLVDNEEKAECIKSGRTMTRTLEDDLIK